MAGDDLFAGLVGLVGDAVVVTREQKIVIANPAAQRLTGMDDLVGRPLTDLLPGLSDVPDGPEPQVARVRTRGGTLRPMSLRAISDGARRVVVIGQQVLPEGVRLNTLSRAMEQSPSAIIITDAEGRIQYVNPRFCVMTGYAAEEILGENPRLLKAEDTPARVYRDMWATIRRREVWRGELKNRRRDGSYYWVVSAVSAISDDNDQVVNYVAVQEDVTEQLMLTRELAQATEEARRANRAKSEFLANMSHELRTPLNSVIGYTQLMQLRRLDLGCEQAGEYLSAIESSGQHLLRLLDGILDLAKIESGRLELSISEVDVTDLVDAALGMVRPSADRRHITLERDTLCRHPSMLRVDATRARQILVNLLSNAIKYNHTGGTVSIGCAPGGPGRFRITVTDTGPGIPEDKREEVFKPFHRLGAEQRAIEGTGIGLALSRELAERMGGLLDYQSTPGEGCAFWLELPSVPCVVA